jgi:hypothetical protein
MTPLVMKYISQPALDYETRMLSSASSVDPIGSFSIEAIEGYLILTLRTHMTIQTKFEVKYPDREYFYCSIYVLYR